MRYVSASDRRGINKYGKPNAILMHPLPRDSRLGTRELSDDLNKNQSLATFAQTDNGISVRMALFALVLWAADTVYEGERDVPWQRAKHNRRALTMWLTSGPITSASIRSLRRLFRSAGTLYSHRRNTHTGSETSVPF